MISLQQIEVLCRQATQKVWKKKKLMLPPENFQFGQGEMPEMCRKCSGNLQTTIKLAFFVINIAQP